MSSSSLSLPEAIETYDKSGVLKVYSDWPKFARLAISSHFVGPKGAFDSCVVVGMGGSGIVGEIAADLGLDSGRVPVSVVKDYHLPRYVNRNTLVVCVSASGNTEETVSAFYEARERGCITSVVSSNGKLGDVAERKGALFYKTPSVHSPRASLVQFLLTVIRILRSASILQMTDQELTACPDALQSHAKNLNVLDEGANRSLNLARWLAGGIPLIYSTPKFRAVGLRFRQSLNENAKLHAYDYSVPELCHNEIVALDRKPLEGGGLETMKPVFLFGEVELDEYKVRLDTVQNLMEEAGIKEVFRFDVSENYRLPQILCAIYDLDITSVYLAILGGIDPTPTRSIDFLKSELATKLNYLSRFGSGVVKRR